MAELVIKIREFQKPLDGAQLICSYSTEAELSSEEGDLEYTKLRIMAPLIMEAIKITMAFVTGGDLIGEIHGEDAARMTIEDATEKAAEAVENPFSNLTELD